MKKLVISKKGGAVYRAPQMTFLEVEPAQVLCGSGEIGQDTVTGNTGVSWGMGEDAEW